MSTKALNMTIGGLAKAAGVNVETVRYYQRRQLLPEPERVYGAIRRYGRADLQRLTFIKSAQGLGFTLNDIAELLLLEDGSHCEETAALAENKLDDVREKLASLQRMEQSLTKLIHRCHKDKTVSCPLISSLQQGLADIIDKGS